MTSLESMNFYTKLLTGLVLLLNIGLLVSIRMAWRFAQTSVADDQTEQGSRLWATAKRHLAILILIVVSINAATVYTNYRMLKASRDIAIQLPDSDSEMIVTMNR